MRVWVLCAVLLIISCQKETASIPDNLPITDARGFIKYTIKAGEHFALYNAYKPVETTRFSFTVRFDSSAIYQTAHAANQHDINKLYGFSDNGTTHHDFSARLGWRWSDGALRVFAYVYNAGVRISEELGAVPIGKDIACRIEVSGDHYQFYCNEYVRTLPRQSTTPQAKGYLLYPYFGGDETAPHEVTIWIKNK